MRAWQIREFGLDGLELVDQPDPEPGPGEVLVHMRAFSLNYRDLLLVVGMYNPKQKLPVVPLSDGAGEVVAIGDGVRRFAVGDRVTPLFFQGWTAGRPTKDRLRTSLGSPGDGTLRELAVFSEEGLVGIPEHLDFAEASTLPCAGVTAWCALEKSGITTGDVLVTQGSGGVSVFALQFARARGVTVIASSSKEEKRERLAELGAAHVLDYTEDVKWGTTVRRTLTNGGADQVIDVGGAGTLEQSLSAVRPGGHVSVIGVLAGPAGPISLIPVLMQGLTVQGVIVGSREDHEAMNRAITARGIRPAVDARFAFADAKAAFEHLQAQKHFGKVVIELDA